MSRSEKIVTGVLLAIFGLIAVAVIGFGWSLLQKKQATLEYNQDFEEDFYDQLAAEGIEIISERQHIEKYDRFALFASSTEEDVYDDVYNAWYYHTFELYDPLIDGSYDEVLSHTPKGKLVITKDNISLYRDQAQVYLDNFELIRDIIKDHGGEAELISGYDPAYVTNYFLLIYLPDASTMINANDDLYDSIYGGYIDENVHNGVKVEIPRFIFCSNEDTYRYMKSNIGKAKDYIRGGNYVCNNSVMTANDIDLEQVCNILLGPKTGDYNVTHVPDVNTLGSPACKNYLQACDPEDFIALYELEIGISYYLTVYDSAYF